MLLRGAERIWTPSGARRSVAVPNGEGVASGSATFEKKQLAIKNLIFFSKNMKFIKLLVLSAIIMAKTSSLSLYL